MRKGGVWKLSADGDRHTWTYGRFMMLQTADRNPQRGVPYVLFFVERILVTVII